jgi:peptidoglycan/xylan/chitin deacetylase (PgdA/CDA1 family)
MLVQSITKVPSATQAAVAFVFDDGYESILPAADYMHSYGFAGNVAVIGRATELPNRGYLNVFQLRTLQDQYGWNMANHSQKHLDAVEVYSQRNLGAYEQDILDGASWLESAGLNSAPNWYIYPHGSTNAELATVVGRFYTFARTVYPGAETFPFGSPLRVKTLELHSPMDSADSASMELTPVSHVAAAIQDASKYHHTLIITLHRINSTPSDRPGYPLDNFKQIVDLVHASGIPVKTLSGLDTMQGVTGSNSFTVTPQDPPLITVQVTATQEPTGGVLNWFRHHF